MAKKVLYYSTDKLYEMKKKKSNKKKNSKKNKKNDPKILTILCAIATLTLTIVSVLLFNSSVAFGPKKPYTSYNEIGNVDYKVYLKDNDFYESSYLNSGMQYVANLIKTVNVKFNYEIHTTEDLEFVNEHKIVSELQITEKNDPSSVLLSRKEDIVPLKKVTLKDNNLVINEEIDIDYEKYNNIVKEYKKELGLIVSSNVILTFETDTNASNQNDKLEKNNKLQIVIPLAESTLKINMNTDKINNSDIIKSTDNIVSIKSKPFFVLFIASVILTIALIVLDIYLYLKHLQKDPYQIKLNNILKNYDRLIVSGDINIDESKYSNIICVDTFKELVDAAENFGVAIMHYEVIKGEKSIFIVSKDDTLVKYRVTKAYLKNKKNKEEVLKVN